LEGAVKAAAFFIALGAVLTWMEWRHLKAAGVKPLPTPWLKRLLAYSQAFVGLILGPLFMVVGMARFLTKVGAL